MRAGMRFRHPAKGRRYEDVLVKWLVEVPPDVASKALDMICVTWQGSRPAYDLVSTDTMYGPAYLQADPRKQDHFFVNGFVV